MWVSLVVPALLTVACATASSAHAGSDFFFGFSDDGPKWGGAGAVEPGRAMGAGAFRITLHWAPGESDLTPQDVTDVANAAAATSGLRLVLAVYGSAASTPQDDASRTEFCRYGKNAVSSPRKRGRVLAEKPRPGATLRGGTKIQLIVGKGPRK